MKRGLVAIAVGVVVVGIGTPALLGLFSPAYAVFSFPATDGSGNIIYRCERLEAAEASEANARSAHAFFEPTLLEIGRWQAGALTASMSPNRKSSEIIPELEKTNARANARRKDANREMQRRFGCGYRGST
jgi:hypothetical protein